MPHPDDPVSSLKHDLTVDDCGDDSHTSKRQRKLDKLDVTFAVAPSNTATTETANVRRFNADTQRSTDRKVSQTHRTVPRDSGSRASTVVAKPERANLTQHQLHTTYSRPTTTVTEDELEDGEIVEDAAPSAEARPVRRRNSMPAIDTTATHQPASHTTKSVKGKDDSLRSSNATPGHLAQTSTSSARRGEKSGATQPVTESRSQDGDIPTNFVRTCNGRTQDFQNSLYKDYNNRTQSERDHFTRQAQTNAGAGSGSTIIYEYIPLALRTDFPEHPLDMSTELLRHIARLSSVFGQDFARARSFVSCAKSTRSPETDAVVCARDLELACDLGLEDKGRVEERRRSGKGRGQDDEMASAKQHRDENKLAAATRGGPKAPMTNDERPAYPRAGQGRVPFPGSSMPNGPGPSRGQRRDNTNTPHNGGYRLPSRDFMGGRGDGEIRVLQQRAEPRLPTASTLGVKVSAKASGSIQATKAAPTSTGSKPQTSTVVRPSQRNAQPSARPRASSLSSGRLLKASGAQAWTTKVEKTKDAAAHVPPRGPSSSAASSRTETKSPMVPENSAQSTTQPPISRVAREAFRTQADELDVARAGGPQLVNDGRHLNGVQVNGVAPIALAAPANILTPSNIAAPVNATTVGAATQMNSTAEDVEMLKLRYKLALATSNVQVAKHKEIMAQIKLYGAGKRVNPH